MAAIMAAGMVPPLTMGIASMLARLIRPVSVRAARRPSCWALLHPEGIPFAARILRVLPVCIVGGAVTGALSMYFGIVMAHMAGCSC